jgi:hypothetical protein
VRALVGPRSSFSGAGSAASENWHPLSCKNPARCVGERVGAGTLTFERRTPTYRVNTIDGDGMNEALEKHSEQLQRHMEKAVRKMNG